MNNPKEEYLNYLPYCNTPKQKEIIIALSQTGTVTAAARSLSADRTNLRRQLETIKKRAAREGYAPDHFDNGVAPGYSMGKVTIQRDGDGSIQRTWERQSPTDEDIIAQVLLDHKWKPAPIIKKPKKANLELLSLYTLTDFHLGMYSYHGETGEDWDTQIASKVLMNAIDDMILKAPDSETGVLNLQGDFLHWDGLAAVTVQSGHILDADTRFPRMIELALDLTAWAIEALLKKHKKVILLVCEGNHDEAGSAWLRKSMKMIWAKNKRVEVIDNDFPYYAILHGETMLGFHHGHKKKMSALTSLFSSEPRFRDMWGKANYTYISCGHYHHVSTKEDAGAIVEQHPTLSARDAYAARGGWVSRRGCKVITYDKKAGEVERATILPREK